MLRGVRQALLGPGASGQGLPSGEACSLLPSPLPRWVHAPWANLSGKAGQVSPSSLPVLRARGSSGGLPSCSCASEHGHLGSASGLLVHPGCPPCSLKAHTRPRGRSHLPFTRQRTVVLRVVRAKAHHGQRPRGQPFPSPALASLLTSLGLPTNKTRTKFPALFAGHANPFSIALAEEQRLVIYFKMMLT